MDAFETRSTNHGRSEHANAGLRRILILVVLLTASFVLVRTGGCARTQKDASQDNESKEASAQGTVNAPESGATSVPTTEPAGSLHYVSADGSQVVVTGTSTLHDWTVKGGTIQGDAVFVGEWSASNPQAIQLYSIDLTIPVNSLKSSEGSGMDDTMYKALDLQDHHEISYKLTTATLKSGPSAGNNEYQFETTGDLTVSGNKRSVNLELKVQPHGQGQLTISTEIQLKMTDFGVKPPTAALGMIKSGDDINVKAAWELASKAAK